MQNLIDQISKIEEAAQRVTEQAADEKKRIDAEMKAKTDAFDREMEAGTAKQEEELRAAYKKKANEALQQQQDAAEAEIARLEQTYREQHEALSDALLLKVIGAD